MNSRTLLNPEHPSFELEWALANITTTFFKCTRWQVEETTDPVSCPYHYFCDSTYQGNYPPAVDLSVLLLAAASYLMAASLAMVEVGRFIMGREPNQPVRRYWIPNGPIILPFILLCLAKGHRINTILPFYYAAPPVLQLIQLSALAFENPPAASVKTVFLEVSTISGILHGSLYVDALILPYYTSISGMVSNNDIDHMYFVFPACVWCVQEYRQGSYCNYADAGGLSLDSVNKRQCTSHSELHARPTCRKSCLDYDKR